MTKPKPKPSPQPPAAPDLDALIRHVLTSLGIDVPYYSARLVGNRLELYLYGGKTLVYPLPSTLPLQGEGQGGGPSLPVQGEGQGGGPSLPLQGEGQAEHEEPAP